MPYSSEQYSSLYESSFLETETLEERLRSIRSSEVYRYRVKTIRAGRILESEIFPIWNTRGEAARARKEFESRKAQKQLNQKNTQKKVTRLANHNFTEKDLWATFSYDDAHLPSSPEEAQRDMVNYLRRLKYKREKAGLPPLRYIYVTEFKTKADENGEKIRVHHHLILSGDMDRDEIERAWANGGRRQTRRLQPDDCGLTGLAKYISKAPKGQRRWGHSLNLKMPIPTVADHKITKRQAEKLAVNPAAAQAFFEKAYKGYAFDRVEVRYSEFVAGAYLYGQLHRTAPPPGKKQKSKKKEQKKCRTT